MSRLYPASGDAVSRLDGFAEVAGLMWPGTATEVSRVARHADRASLRIIPGRRRPRLLVPSSDSRAASLAVLRHGSPSTILARSQRRGISWILRSGAGSWLFRYGYSLRASSQTVLDYLGDIVGEPLLASLPLSAARANRKPVLHLLDARGRTLAFVKVGVNTLTKKLVRREASVLARLNRLQLTTVRVPEVVHAGVWNDLELLVLSALPTWRGGPPDLDSLRESMHEVAAATTPDPASSATGHDYVRELLSRMRVLAAHGAPKDQQTASQLESIVLELDPTAVTTLPLGAWHGDWTPWNCRMVDGRCLVWDWERYEAPVPVGFDALHYSLQHAVATGSPRLAAADRCLSGAPELLRSWPLSPLQASSAATLYLAEIGVRYLEDQQRELSGAGGDISEWIVPALLSRG